MSDKLSVHQLENLKIELQQNRYHIRDINNNFYKHSNNNIINRNNNYNTQNNVCIPNIFKPCTKVPQLVRLV